MIESRMIVGAQAQDILDCVPSVVTTSERDNVRRLSVRASRRVQPDAAHLAAKFMYYFHLVRDS